MADHQFLLDYECKLKQRDKLERISKELIVRGIGKKISDLRSFQYWAILAKLDELKENKHWYLEKSRCFKSENWSAGNAQNDFHGERSSYRSLKKQREEAIDTCNLSTAKNFFVHDGFKKLHSEQEEYEKTLAKIRQREQME